MRWWLWLGAMACTSAEVTGPTGDSGLVDTVPTDTPQTEEGWPEDWADQEREVFRITNINRMVLQVCGGDRMGAVGQLTWNDQLRDAARTHSRNMARRGFFDHRSPSGSVPEDRASDAGYVGQVGENIAKGQATPREVMEGWMDSPGHCANIMTGEYVALGVGLYVHEGIPHWTQVFGTER